MSENKNITTEEVSKEDDKEKNVNEEALEDVSGGMILYPPYKKY
jgi:hypothetical protein